MRHRPEYVGRPGSPGRPTAAQARRLWLTVAGLGAVVCVVASVALVSPVAGGVGVAPVYGTTASASSAPSTIVTSVTRPPSSMSAPPTAPDVTAVTPTSAAPTPTTSAPAAVPLAGVPVTLRLDVTDSPIRIVPIGVSAEGVLDPPADVTTAGWWVAGPRPGAPGRTVITGHVDSRTAGLGAFAALDDVDPGDLLTVTTADGRDLVYQVTARDEIEKTRLDPAVLAGSEVSDLLLVTCIGVFDTDTRSYESNLLITAVPLID